MYRPRNTIRFRRCLAPPRAVDSICRFQRALLPNALPEVATLDIVRTPVSGLSSITTRTMSKVARPPDAPRRSWGREGLSTFDFGLSTPFDGTPAHRPRPIRVGGSSFSVFRSSFGNGNGLGLEKPEIRNSQFAMGGRGPRYTFVNKSTAARDRSVTAM